LSPGDHLCVFYRGRQERDELLLPFLADGLRAGDAVFFLAAEGERGDISARLGADGDLLLTEPEGGHLRGGRFAPDELLATLQAWAASRFAGGAAVCGRLVGDMSWAKPPLSPALIEQLVAEEVMVTRWLARYPLVALCLYDLNLFDGSLIIPMIRAHPQAWMAGTLIENPYYLLPAVDGAGPAEGRPWKAVP
jgi:hypothetical protein